MNRSMWKWVLIGIGVVIFWLWYDRQTKQKVKPRDVQVFDFSGLGDSTPGSFTLGGLLAERTNGDNAKSLLEVLRT